MSRLISSLLLLKNGYKWIQYVSLEHEIESRKLEYYRELRRCQAQRPNEDVTTGVMFFMDTLKNIQNQLMDKLEQSGIETSLSPKEKTVLAEKLNIPNPTTKKILKKLLLAELIEKFGTGRGTNYSFK